MADEFQLGTGNWWDGTRNRCDSGSTAPASTALNSMGSFAWQTEIVGTKARSSMDSVSVSGSSMGVFTDSQKLQGHESSSGAGLLGDPNLQMMGLGLSSQSMDWNLFRGEKAESSFHPMLQEEQGNANFQQEATASQDQWRHKLFGGSSDQDLSATDFKQFNRALSLDQQQYSPHTSSNNSTITSQDLNTNFQVDTAPYGSPNVLQGFLVADNQPQQSTFDGRSMNYPYPSSYVINTADQLVPSNSNWSKFPQFLRTSPSKQPPHGQLHFSNNTPYWNASTAAISTDARPSFFPSLRTQPPTSSFEEKPKQTTSEVRELAKKTSSEASSNKRPRNETTTSPMPAFKVRKEKMGDRITALQQLVSPFGKTDTASVLTETIEYIKFLHEQINVLSNPYMKSGAHIQHQQNPDKSKDPEGPKQDLRSRGLCLVPVPSTFTINEPNFDLWNPTFGGTYR